MNRDEFEEVSASTTVSTLWLDPALGAVGEQVAGLLGDPRDMHGLAYGFRSDDEILSLDV
jgi:hypothetical protein